MRMMLAQRTPVQRGRPADNDDTSATWLTEPSRRGQRRQRYCRGVRVVAGVGRRTWCCRGRRAAASGFKREVTINRWLREQMLDGATRGGVGQCKASSSSSLRRMATMDGIFPCRRRDGDGCGDAAVPSNQRRRRLRRG
jgi:hypothetical protein